MLCNQLAYIPREFINNEFIMDRDNIYKFDSVLQNELNGIDSEIESGEMSDDVSMNTQNKAITYKSNNATVRNSEQNFKASQIHIQD